MSPSGDAASHHWVSEAVYLSDPDGHGIELYADRPRDEWPRRDGRILMATEPLDLDSLMGELAAGEEPSRFLPPGTRFGHIHLHVSRVERAVQAVARRLEQAGADVEPLYRLGDEVLQVATVSGASTPPGLLTRDEDGHTIAVVSAGIL